MPDEMEIMTGYDLAWTWLNETGAAPQPAEGFTCDASWIWEASRLDWDYLMAYLLEVRTGDTYDYLCVFQAHAPSDYPDHGLQVEWYNHPRNIHDRAGDDYGQDTAHWFIDWAFGRREAYFASI